MREKREFSSLRRLPGLFIILACLTACQAETVVDTIPTPSSEPTVTSVADESGGCQLGADFNNVIAEGAGYETAQQAIAAWQESDDHQYPGVPMLESEEEDRAVWALVEDTGQKVGEVQAFKAEWGLWVIEGGDWCLEGTYEEK